MKPETFAALCAVASVPAPQPAHELVTGWCTGPLVAKTPTIKGFGGCRSQERHPLFSLVLCRYTIVIYGVHDFIDEEMARSN